MVQKLKRSEKRGVSPVVATVLLILIVVIVAIIIFSWAKGWFKESLHKFTSDKQEVSIEQVCRELQFDADASIVDDKIKIDIINNGNFAIYGLSVKRVGAGTTRIEEIKDLNLYSGDSKSDNSLDSGEETSLKITPIVLGQKKNGEESQPYTCLEIEKEISLE